MSIYTKPLYNTKFNVEDFTYQESEPLTEYEGNLLYIRKHGNDNVTSNLTFNGAVSMSNVTNLNGLDATKIAYLDVVQNVDNIQDISINILENSSVNYDLSINELIAKDVQIDISLNEGLTYTDSQIANLIDSAPVTMDTLAEIGQVVTDNSGFIFAMNNILTDVDTSLNTVFTDVDNIQTVDANQDIRMDGIDTDIDNIETTLTNTSYSNNITTIANDLQLNGTNGINITSSSASTSVTIGKNSNSNTGSTCLGNGANSNNPGIYATNVGFSCGNNTCGANSVGIGRNCNEINSGLRSFGIGSYCNYSGASAYAIGIGHNCNMFNAGLHNISFGRSNKQDSLINAPDYCICINATGSNINSSVESSCIIAPIRNDTTPSSHKLLGYTSGKEVIQSDNFDIICNSINSISSSEISYLDGVTSNIQTQFTNITDYVDNENTTQNTRMNNVDTSLNDIIAIDINQDIRMNGIDTRIDNVDTSLNDIEATLTNISYSNNITTIDNNVITNDISSNDILCNSINGITATEINFLDGTITNIQQQYFDQTNYINAQNAIQDTSLNNIITVDINQDIRMDNIDTSLSDIINIDDTQHTRLNTLEEQCTVVYRFNLFWRHFNFCQLSSV